MSRRFLQGLVIGLLAAAVAGLLYSQGFLAWLENPLWDGRVKVFAKPGIATDRICLVLIDQYTLDWAEKELGEGWPWPREIYEPLLHACKQGGARAILFDLIFTEPSAYGVSDDMAFANAIENTTNFVTALWLSREYGTEDWPSGIQACDFDMEQLSVTLPAPAEAVATVPFASFPADRLATNVSHLGSILTDQDSDAIIRRIPAFHIFDSHFVPVLGIAGALVDHADVIPVIKNDNLILGPYRVPIDREGRVILRYRGQSQTHKSVNAAPVLQSGIRMLLEGKDPVIDLSIFKDAYVLLGTVAPALKDLRPTPLSRNYPGVEIHATLLDNLLSDDFIRDADPHLVLALTILLAVLSGITIRLIQKGGLEVALAILLLLIPLAIGFACYPAGIWMPISLPLVATTLALGAGLTTNYALEGRQKRFIRSAFKQYLSPAVVERIADNPDNLKLGGELRELSIYFSDVQGFTTISESLTPQDLTALLNEYLTAMTDIILEEGGTVDKYEGDAIIAFWNAPLDLENHAIHAVRAALRCQQALTEMRPRLKEKYGRDIFARIGLNTGQVVVGNMGSSQRFDYTFLGDAGNLAARLEGINKQFGTFLMISEYTLKQLGDTFAARELSRVRVVGKVEPVVVYEPMFREDFDARAKQLAIFDQGLQAFYRGEFKAAITTFEKISTEDPAAEHYIAKCRSLLDCNPRDWDGVWIMTEK